MSQGQWEVCSGCWGPGWETPRPLPSPACLRANPVSRGAHTRVQGWQGPGRRPQPQRHVRGEASEGGGTCRGARSHSQDPLTSPPDRPMSSHRPQSRSRTIPRPRLTRYRGKADCVRSPCPHPPGGCQTVPPELEKCLAPDPADVDRLKPHRCWGSGLTLATREEGWLRSKRPT